MFILIIVLLTGQGSVSVSSSEFSNSQSCYNAKAAIEATLPTQVAYVNYHSLQCVAK